MKNFLQNLLIFFALCLCGLLAFQWHRETRLQQRIQSLTDAGQGRLENVRNLQRALQQAEDEVKRLDRLKTELGETVNTNRVEIIRLRQELAQAGAGAERSAKQIAAYKTALEQANGNIQRQNGEMQRLAAERNDAAVKYNKLVAEYDELVKKWNDSQASPAATNAPASPKK